MPQQKSKKIFIYVFLFLFIGTFNNRNLSNFNFPNINKIHVTGLDEKNNLKLENDLSFLKINNLFFTDKSKIVELINSHSLVEKYSVFIRYPSTLNIKIIQTEFLAQIKKDGDYLLLGSNGKLIKNKGPQKNTPFIFGDLNNTSFFELKNAIDETEFEYKKIKNLYFFKSGRWDIETVDGLLIKLPKKELKKSLQLFIDVMSKNKDSKINKIDLRQFNQIVLSE
tara:strand:- start:6418 stop:7089 length:672 start_codon:yes stop_codon:yes gene_type:complete